jgi:hypothetical protein
LPGLAAWYDASQHVGASDDDPVRPQDYSGNGRHQTQATEGLRPLYKTAIQGGLPVFRYDGTDDRTHAVFTLNQPFTRVMIAKLRSVPPTTFGYLSAGGVENVGVILNTTGSSTAFMNSGVSLAIGSLGTTAFNRIAAVFNGASSARKLNASFATGNAGAFAAGGVSLGNDAVLDRPSAVDIGELAVYSRALSEAEIDQLFEYLAGKWAL